MLPTILAHEINTGLKNFLMTGFETPTPYFRGIFSRFTEGKGNLSKGPYLSINLPFLQGGTGKDYFDRFETEFPPFVHQEHAWSRLRSGDKDASTIIATGTGSGKTECFLYPILDHCLKDPGHGIKAIIIYPMNALATDQAKRFAKAIHSAPALKGKVRVGLFVGENEKTSHKSMSEDFVITDKNVQRDAPPDILLTNYKMLDYLLIRPQDQPLWRFNDKETFKYLVVDELHTFDGAQGTDLACLIRRLKARLNTPQNHLLAVGTSATLGSGEEKGDLRQYAEQIFQEPFNPGSIVGEQRQTKEQFLKNILIEYQFSPPINLSERLDPDRYDSLPAYIKAQYSLLFQDEMVEDPTDSDWRRSLGEKLKKHILFSNLLQLLLNQPRSLDEIAAELAKTLPRGEPRELSYDLLNSLCALISFARDPAVVSLPLVQLRLQFWVRELRRMVTHIVRPPETVQLMFADDLKQGQHDFYLPLVQCSQCHATAWIGHQLPGQDQVKNDLRAIYNAFFNNSPETTMLLPLTEEEKTPTRPGLEKYLCPSCGQLQQNGQLCQACGEYDLVRVFVPDNLKEKKTRSGDHYYVSERNCPRCGAKGNMLVFGSRAASLASIAIHHSFATSYNDDKKLLAFSDSVQDAAHRAGFFSARTWQNNIRMAIAQALKNCGSMQLTDFYTELPKFWQNESINPKAFDEVGFICQFIAPNMLWYNDYHALLENGRLPDGNQLARDISKRLEWEVLAEVGYRSRIGRSLVQTGTLAVGFDQVLLSKVVERLLEPFAEQFGIKDLNSHEVHHFVLGFLLHLKERGAIYHPFLKTYIDSGGRNYLLLRQSYLPTFTQQTTSPIFLTDADRHAEFDVLCNRKGKSWYQQWCYKSLGQNRLLPENLERELYELTLEVLEKEGLVQQIDSKKETVWGLNPAALYLSNEVACFTTSHRASRLIVPRDMSELVVGMPSLEIGILENYAPDSNRNHWLADIYCKGDIQRVIGQEHTGLLDRETRQRVEEEFIHRNKPWHPNLLSATPTLEMGIDIGDLSSVLMCSVPPTQANYLQRIGRAGRKDGNSFNLTFAAGVAHDLYFYAEPLQMMAGRIESPGVFLNASAVVERQFTAFCLDHWVRTGVAESAIPKNMKAVLDHVEQDHLKNFPHNFLDFTEQNALDLFDDFIALFEGEFTQRTIDHLRKFLVNDSKVDGLEMRLIRRLHELVAERNNLKSRIDALKRSIDSELKKPQDEATQERIEQARRERSGLQEILRVINRKETLNFFTDEGLIPNYAFPEAGVSLRSVIYRKRNEPKDGESNYINEVYEYERPGAAAISELAPNNRFFAGGRQVKIEQINLNLSEIEMWRFCPSCAHSENLSAGDHHDVCPRCSAPMWADRGQLCKMVRLKQVMASTSDRDSRIGDDVEDREPTFYSRQMLADFKIKDIERAWRISGDLLPFGFEFIRRTTFREMNFGEYSGAAEPSLIAGVENIRPGFRVCQYCGMVQQRKISKQAHAFTCKAKDKEDEENLIDCLYLYREFVSEAIRILLPVSVVSGSESYLNSFIAAIQLGLKKKFGGKVDHLRMMAYDEPIPGTDTKRQFLMLYDSVPGGTGYLHELLDNHQNLLEVFRLARDTMANCSCNHDSAKDGCYRCLLAYRNSYGMETTSRKVAVELLGDILGYEDKFEETTSIGDIESNPLFDSELEARFVEAIKRMALEGLDVQIQPQVVRGKPGYFLRVNQRIYTIEPQVNLGPKEGAQIPCCPDFYIRSARESEQIKPICIFLDGLKYHKDIVNEDTAKRLSLVQGGQYWQWSLTWQDINRYFIKSASDTRNPFIEGLQPEMQPVQTVLGEKLDLGVFTKYATRSSLEQLILFLGNPMLDKWRGLTFVRILGWLKQETMFSEETRQLFIQKFSATAPIYIQQLVEELSGQVAYGGLGFDGDKTLLQILCAIPEEAITSLDPARCIINIHLRDEAADDETFKSAWQAFLKGYNLLQFLPRVAFTTAKGIVSGSYEGLHWNQATGKSQTAETTGSVALDAVLDDVLDEFKTGITALSEKGLVLPTICYELQDESGEILAEAELAWIETKVVGLYIDQLENSAVFEKQGWTVFELDQEGAWVEDIAKAIKGETV